MRGKNEQFWQRERLSKDSGMVEASSMAQESAEQAGTSIR